MNYGPEDSKAWKTQASKPTDTPASEICRVCGNQIEFWHCTDAGCPWCKQCGIDNEAVKNAQG